MVRRSKIKGWKTRSIYIRGDDDDDISYFVSFTVDFVVAVGLLHFNVTFDG